MSTLPDARYGLREGELFAGKYRIDRVLGAGGMGMVVLAHHVELDDRVAIKLLLPEVLNHGEAVTRFFREAQAAAKIKSEHVARVRDVGSLDSGAPYMVMEFLEGEDLGAWVEQRGPLAPALAAELLLQACEAIAEAHALGIVHRDLKPSNLFVTQQHGTPLVKVLDLFTAFGGFAACNAILGNEPEYRLVAGEAGDSGTPRGGSGGRPSSAGGATQGGTTGDAGTGEGPLAGSDGEAGGAAATGGASSTGGQPAEAGAGNEPGSSGGSAGEPGGMTGTGGADTCEPSGPEDCFNGTDDDCNGAVDCEDEACAATRCVAAPRGAIFGDFGSSCAPGAETIRLYQGLTSASECEGCSCTPTSSDCDAGIYNFGAKTCPGFDFQPGLQNTFASSCQPLGGDTKIHYYSIRGLTNCEASGTPRLPPVSWATETTFCPDERAGGGCGSGSACIPDDGPRCVLLEGANASCPSGYTRDTTGPWYTGYSDQRTCSACYCGFVTGACTGARLEVYSMFGCGGTSLVVSNGEEGDNCALPFGAASARIIGTADPMNCPPQSYADDKLDETGGRTVCCR